MTLEKEAIKEIRSGIFLNNNLRPASDGRTFEVVNPSNKEVAVKELLKKRNFWQVLCEMALSGQLEVDSAIEEAQRSP